MLHARVGLVVPMYGHSAVERNRLKRRLREIVRTQLLPCLPPVDFLIRSRPSAYGVEFPILVDELTRAADNSSELLL